MADNPPAPAGTPRKKSAMSSPWTWVIVGAVALGAGAWFLLRRGSSGGSSSTTASDTSSGGTDYSGEISTLQTEIADLQSTLAQGGGTGSGGGTGGGTGGGSGSGGGTGGGDGHPGGGPGTVPPPVSVPPGTGGGGAKRPAMPAGVRVTKVTPTQVGLAWTKVPGATDYRVRATYQGKLAAQRTASTPAITIDGLTPDHTYTFHVAASNAAGISPETNGPAQKTPRAGSTPTAPAGGGRPAPAGIAGLHTSKVA